MIERVICYIQSNVDQPLNLNILSELANCSPFHFHRIFNALVGLSVGKYVALQRLKKACYQLVFRQQLSVLEIALASGYENASSLSREFKKKLGVSPSVFRKQANWDAWQLYFDSQLSSISHCLLGQNMQNHHFDDVTIVNFPHTDVAALEHKGAPEKLINTLMDFVAWRKEHGPSPKISHTYNILYDDPNTVEPEAFCFDVCAAITKPIKANNQGVIMKHIPAGRCAKLRHRGSDQNLGQSIQFLYSQWLTQSDQELRDFPCFIQRLNFYPEVAEHELEIDIFLPIN